MFGCVCVLCIIILIYSSFFCLFATYYSNSVLFCNICVLPARPLQCFLGGGVWFFFENLPIFLSTAGCVFFFLSFSIFYDFILCIFLLCVCVCVFFLLFTPRCGFTIMRAQLLAHQPVPVPCFAFSVFRFVIFVICLFVFFFTFCCFLCVYV